MGAEVPDFDEDRWHEYSPGIHFFLTREEAEEVYFMPVCSYRSYRRRLMDYVED